jgi:hypothetical protein
MRVGEALLMRLLPLLMGEEEGEGGERKKERRNPRDVQGLARALRDLVGSGETEPGTLALFNSLACEGEHWVCIPFVFGRDADSLWGTIRLLFRANEHEPAVLVVETGGAGRWSFRMAGADRHMSVYSADTAALNNPKQYITALRGKLRNHGVIVDDSIKDVAFFDGFWDRGFEAAGPVDTMG